MCYTDAPACEMLATHCVVCGRPLVDAESVECGVGPDCRANSGLETGIADATRTAANRLTHEAAVAARKGAAERVLEIAAEVEALGLTVLAGKMRERFTREPVIRIREEGQFLVVETPWKRDSSFLTSWYAIPGRKWDKVRRVNLVPVSQRAALWALLRRWFAKKYGVGPKGLFRVEV